MLESEIRGLKDLLDEKVEKIDALARIASEEQIMQSARHKARKRNEPSKLEPAQVSELKAKHFRVYTFEVERTQPPSKVIKRPGSLNGSRTK